jgi:outer membrane protein
LVLICDRRSHSHCPAYTSRWLSRILVALISIFGSLLITAGYAQQAPPDPSKPFFSPEQDRVRPRTPVQPTVEFELNPTTVYTLPALIDIAESRSPETREAWQAARFRAAALGVAKSELYPIARAFLVGFTNEVGVLLYNQFALQYEGIGEAGLSLDYTLLDFGARLDRIHEQGSQLRASNFAFNDAHRKLIYGVTQSYYQLLSAAGQRRAAEANVRSAEAVADAIQARYDNGLATLPDVAEAKSAAAQARYDLQIRVGDEQKASGALATLLTAPPYSQFKVQDIDTLTIPETLPDNARELIEKALRNRPDLLQQLALIKAAKAAEQNAKKAYYPTLTFNGDFGRLRAYGDQLPYPNAYASGNAYDATLRLGWTFFDGGRRQSELQEARAAEQQAQSILIIRHDQIESEVWNAYTNAETALRQRQAAIELLLAAQQSYDMSLEAYHYGVRNVLDVLQAERQLAAARSEDVSARAAVLNSMADISFRTAELLHRGVGQNP